MTALKNILTPNVLTISRLVAIIPFIACFFVRDSWARWVILGIFIFASITDYFDGYLARKQNATSKLGQMLDPIADKLLVICALFMLSKANIINGWHLIAVVIIFCREIFVSGLREFVGQKKAVTVSKLAKYKTTAQMLAVGLLLALPAFATILERSYVASFYKLSLIFLWVAAILTVITGYQYFRASQRYLK